MKISGVRGAVLATLGADGKGLVVVGGQPMRVSWSQQTIETNPPFKKIVLELNVTDMLDEEQQREKIARLRGQLESEQEKLEGIQTLLKGEGWVTKGDDS